LGTKMFGKIDVREIVTDHFGTLVDNSTQRASPSDYALFFGLPVLIAAALAWMGLKLDAGAVNVLITVLSIFIGLLLNLLLLIHGLLHRESGERDPAERQLLRQLYRNISYDILISIVALFPLIALAILPNSGWLTRTASTIVFFLVGHFLLTLLMILKRVHALLTREFRRPS
jgi:hypothetical protein